MEGKKQNQILVLQAFKGISNEHEEELVINPVWKRKPNFSKAIDATRSHLNFEITKNGNVVTVDLHHSIAERIKELFVKEGIKDPNKGLNKPRYRTVANIIIGGSYESMYKLAFYKQLVNMNNGADNSNIQRVGGIEHWAKDMYNFFAKKYGEKYIVAFIVHLDVNNPYANCIVVPVAVDSKGNKTISWKKTFVGGEGKIADFKRSMSTLMDELAEVNKKYGLLRGESNRFK